MNEDTNLEKLWEQAEGLRGKIRKLKQEQAIHQEAIDNLAETIYEQRVALREVMDAIRYLDEN